MSGMAYNSSLLKFWLSNSSMEGNSIEALHGNCKTLEEVASFFRISRNFGQAAPQFFGAIWSIAIDGIESLKNSSTKCYVERSWLYLAFVLGAPSSATASAVADNTADRR